MSADTLLSLILEYRYLVIFPLACFEGPIVSLACGFLISTGVLNPFITFPIFILGDVIPDCTYFWLGHRIKSLKFFDTYGHKIRMTPERLKSIEHLWHAHTLKAMMLTKWAYGISTPLLILSGTVHLPTLRFLRSTISISALQYGGLLLIGYWAGESYEQYARYVENVSLVIGIGLVLAIIFYILVSRYAKKKVLEETA